MRTLRPPPERWHDRQRRFAAGSSDLAVKAGNAAAIGLSTGAKESQPIGMLSCPPKHAYRALRPAQKRRGVMLVLWATVIAAALSDFETSIPSTSWTGVAGNQRGQLQHAKLYYY